MKLHRRIITSAGLGVTALLISISQILPVAAAPTPVGGQALEIGPPVLNVSGDPGATINSSVKLRNVSDGSMIVSSDVNDFTASGSENGSPSIILNNTEPNPYSMIAWVKPLADMTLKPKQMVTIPIRITIPTHAAPGGYYAAIRFTGRPADLSSTGVSLSASIATLVLMKVNGDAKEGMSLVEFSAHQNAITGSIFESMPVQFTVRIKNTGNLHEQPTGHVTVKDMFGKVVATLAVNADQRNVLPQSIRKFETTLDSTAIGNRILFGRYTADLNLTYGTNKAPVTQQLSFWIIPYRLIGLAILGLVAAFFVLRFLIRRYNRAIINKAQGGSTKPAVKKPAPKTKKK